MKIKKGQRFTITNINPDWDEMGISMKEWNESDNNPKVINGEIYVYDERFCKEGEVVKQSWTPKEDIEDENIFYDWCGDFSWLDGQFYQKYGLLVEDGIEIKVVSHRQYLKNINTPIDVRNIKYKTIVEIIK